MKRTLIFSILLLITASAVFSQENVLETAYLKCQYKHSYLKDTLDVATFDDLLILQIGKNLSKCYSYYTFQLDSLLRTPDGHKVWQDLFSHSLEDFNRHHDRKRFLNSFPRARSSTFIYKNYPKGVITVTDGIENDDFIYKDTLNAQHWEIKDSTKTILGYDCQMATCDFRGRTWTAWFAPDIPISDGPWKFGGLPGLIMEAYDRGKQYQFIIVGLEQVVDEHIIFLEPAGGRGKFREIDRRELLKAKMNQLVNSGAFMKAETGVPFKDKPVYRDLIERDYK